MHRNSAAPPQAVVPARTNTNLQWRRSAKAPAQATAANRHSQPSHSSDNGRPSDYGQDPFATPVTQVSPAPQTAAAPVSHGLQVAATAPNLRSIDSAPARTQANPLPPAMTNHGVAIGTTPAAPQMMRVPVDPGTPTAATTRPAATARPGTTASHAAVSQTAISQTAWAGEPQPTIDVFAAPSNARVAQLPAGRPRRSNFFEDPFGDDQKAQQDQAAQSAPARQNEPDSQEMLFPPPAQQDAELFRSRPTTNE